ncbi:hypothetical protein DP117_34125 [Brasilonema sp. UFV-L1]|nr:hypothetical protein [Brasilonema sp. UFV-L1]
MRVVLKRVGEWRGVQQRFGRTAPALKERVLFETLRLLEDFASSYSDLQSTKELFSSYTYCITASMQ